jgi:predicted DCC family thiol-disulfide oxidoreductase YuxK
VISEITKITNVSARGWLLYDGTCGACSNLARGFRRRLETLGYQSIPMQTPWVVQQIGAGTNPGEILLLLPDGKLLGGVDAILEIARQIPWARPLAWVAQRCFLLRILRRLYRGFANHRGRISSICRLNPDLNESTTKKGEKYAR